MALLAQSSAIVHTAQHRVKSGKAAAHIRNPSPWEVEAVESEVCRLWLLSEFKAQDSLYGQREGTASTFC